MKKVQLIPITSAIALLLVAIFIVMTLKPEPVRSKANEPIYQPVSTITVTPQPYRPTIQLLGITQPRWQSEIKAQTEGKVIWLNNDIEPGSLVKKGDILIKLETTELEAQVALANTQVKQAELDLQREQHKQTVAIKMLVNVKASAFARREPQIATAKARLEQAHKDLISANKRLKEAIITAPYDAIVLAKSITPGQYVINGQTLFQFASSTAIDIRVPVPESKWKALSSVLAEPIIQIHDKQRRSWNATVRFIAPQADTSTRQRQVILSVKKPYQTQPRLLPHQQVSASIIMPSHSKVFSVPSSAITRDGQLWIVNDQNQLALEPAVILEEKNQHAWVTLKIKPALPIKVVIYPLLSMIEGQHVMPENYEDKLTKGKL